MRLVIVFLCLALLPAGLAAAQAQPFVYPARGQNQQRQDIDSAECRSWAQSQTSGRPPAPGANERVAGTVGGAARGAALGAAVGAIAGNAGKGAAAGAVVGGVGGRRGAISREQQAQATAVNDYQRAFGACMGARGYSVR
jgi:outer membrane lipoprotein SlyB